MTLLRSMGIYALLLVLFWALIMLKLEISWFSGWILFCAYFVFGIILNRLVLSKLITWSSWDRTIDNVSSTKLSALLFWPISYPWLFLKLLIVKYL